jgi:hypothetical protein
LCNSNGVVWVSWCPWSSYCQRHARARGGSLNVKVSHDRTPITRLPDRRGVAGQKHIIQWPVLSHNTYHNSGSCRCVYFEVEADKALPDSNCNCLAGFASVGVSARPMPSFLSYTFSMNYKLLEDYVKKRCTPAYYICTRRCPHNPHSGAFIDDERFKCGMWYVFSLSAMRKESAHSRAQTSRSSPL